MPLARIGIAGGRKIQVDGLLGTGRAFSLGDFSQGALSQCGFMRIARKIVDGRMLTVPEVELLLSTAPLAVLMKLVQVKNPGRRPAQKVMPAVVLPLKLWVSFESDVDEVIAATKGLLESIPNPEVSVAFDTISLGRYDDQVEQLIAGIKRCRSGITLVAPPIEEVTSVLMENSGSTFTTQKLRDFLIYLRRCGFDRLQSSTCEKFLSVTKELGFLNSLRTEIDRFSVRELAEELVRLREITDRKSVDIWIPGLRPEKIAISGERGIEELTLLRSLAVGALLFDHVSCIRASSRFFSQQGLQIALRLGADDLGFAAFNKITQAKLKLQLLSSFEGRADSSFMVLQ